jgi:hypothetical protein
LWLSALVCAPKRLLSATPMLFRASISKADDVGYDQFVLSLRPVAVQFPAVLVVFKARPQLRDHGCEIIG